MSFIARITNYEDPKSLSARFRTRRAEKIKALINRIFHENGECRILDIGGTAPYWKLFGNEFLQENNAHVTLSNIEYDPEMREISDLARFSIDTGDGCNLPYKDNSFHLVHSNSVIEHVGDWSHMTAFAAEIRRLAPRYYVQTPYFWFPYEPHFGAPFFQWLPEPTRVSLIMRRSMGHFPRADSLSRAVGWAQSARLLDRKEFAFLFPDSTVVFEKFMGLPKSLIAIRDQPGEPG